MVVTGDLTQVDLPRGERSGLGEAVKVLRGMKGVSFVHFDDTDVVRHPLVARMVRAYQSYEKKGDRNGQPGPTNDEAAS
jgi:phosphate starvation-inducible PhoH-like protein